MNEALFKLRNTRMVDGLYRAVRNTLSGPGWGGFHRDRIYQSLVLELLTAHPFTSFVETGTYRGYSTELVAHRFPKLPVFTTEVVEATYVQSGRSLRKYPNITMLLGSSDAVVQKLLEEKKVGQMPLCYLDAHWQTYWPLRKELEAIGRAGVKSVIVIDDFQVPGQAQFGYDIDGGADVTAGEECNLRYIQPALVAGQTYHAAFPKYNLSDAFASGAGQLRGHIALFQNMGDEYEAFLRTELGQKHYFGHGVVAPAARG